MAVAPSIPGLDAIVKHGDPKRRRDAGGSRLSSLATNTGSAPSPQPENPIETGSEDAATATCRLSEEEGEDLEGEDGTSVSSGSTIELNSQEIARIFGACAERGRQI